MSKREYGVTPGDPHNDQMAARASEELNNLLDSIVKLRKQTEDEPSMMAVIASSLVAENYPPMHLASLLAAALLRLTKEGQS